MKTERRSSSRRFTAPLALAVLLASPAAARAQAGQHLRLTFVKHATFFSQATHRAPDTDPQVFVKDDVTPAGADLQRIAHAAGLRPARVDDVGNARLYDAQGRTLGFTLDKWFGATGTADIGSQRASDRITCSFRKLIAFGVYSLFRIAFSPQGATFTPLDGAGSANNFRSGVDGTANVVVTSPQRLQPGDAIVLIYHSDAVHHGSLRGELGVTAHHELIVRLP